MVNYNVSFSIKEINCLLQVVGFFPLITCPTEVAVDTSLTKLDPSPPPTLQQNCPTVPSLIFQFVPREKFFNKYITRITKVGHLLSNANFSFASHFPFFLLSLFLISHLFLLPLCPSGTSCLSCQSKHLKFQLGPRICNKKSTFFSRSSQEEGK